MSKPESRIAIIGMACRLPGGANSPESLWSMLAEGRDGRKEVPRDRWDWKSFYNKNPDTKDAINFSHACFLDEDLSAFDARFFNISSVDAATIDPQQRLLLEVTYEALENAGLPIESLRGSNTSVHMGMFARDYDRMGYRDISQVNMAHIIGSGDAILANRISYVLDLKGSSNTLDTGCSGSLVALHQACQTLRSDEATVALAGASQLLLSPDQSIAMSQLTNEDGRCYAFDDRGAGYVRGEGLGVLVLKRLDKAVADADQIHAVIVESGVGHDGKTSGIFLPNGDAQEALARSVYMKAGLDPRDTLFVESHGTGTVAGDNAEVGSIARVFGREAGRTSDLPIGSIKANIGHLEAASGVASMIKAIMILKKNQIPPQLNFVNQKPSLRLQERGLKVPLELVSLTPPGYVGPRRVSVNSFGYGGTNAHAILEAHVPAPLPTNAQINGSVHTVIGHERIDIADPKLIVFSATSEGSLSRLVLRLREWLVTDQSQSVPFGDLVYTMNIRRSKFLWRCSVVASDFQELEVVLRDAKLRPVKSRRDVSLAFIFTGQGAQWYAMGRELLICSESREFASSIALCDQSIKALGCQWGLLEELSRDEGSSRLGEASFAQPITTAVQIALVDLLATTYGIRPQAVCGHSSGEIAAAYAVGALTKDAAMRVAYMRGVCSAKAKELNTTPGGMLAVGEGEAWVEMLIKQLGSANGTVTVACVNSPKSTTVSGDLAALSNLESALEAASIFNRRLQVDSAYHSHHMNVVAPHYLSSLEGLTHGTAREEVAFFSSVTSTRKRSGFGPSYWVSNLVSQVKFCAASRLVAQHLSNADSLSTAANIVIEVGPHAALSGPLRQSLSDSNFKLSSGSSFQYNYVSCLIRKASAISTVLTLVGKVFESGSTVQLQSGGLTDKRQAVGNLPSYPWDHSTGYWRESRLSKGIRLRPFPPHDLLGLFEVSSSPYEPRWRYHVSLTSVPWLRDHVVEGFVIFPGAGYLIMVIEAMKQLFQLRKTPGRIASINFRDTTFAKPVVIHDDSIENSQEVELQLIISPSRQCTGSPWEHFRVVSYDIQSDAWMDNCSGLVAWDSAAIDVEAAAQADEGLDVRDDGLGHLTQAAAEQWLHDVQRICPTPLDVTAIYRELKASGNEYGESFQGLKEIHVGKGHATASIAIPDIAQYIPGHYMQPHTIHPSTFDSIFQLEHVCFRQEGLVAPIMSAMLGDVSVAVDMISTPGTEIMVALQHFQQTPRAAALSFCAYQKRSDGTFRPVITCTDFRTQVVGEVDSDQGPQKMTYRMEWKALPKSASTPEGGLDQLNTTNSMAKVHLGCPDDSAQVAIGDAMCRSLGNKGIQCRQEAWNTSSDAGLQGHNPNNLVIIIDGAERPLLLDPADEMFENMKQLLIQGGNILWVSFQTSAPSGDKTALKSMVNGMGRVLRRENPGLRLVVIDVQDQVQPCSNNNEELQNIVRTLTNVAMSSFWGPRGEGVDDTKLEHEYTLREGKLHVPRVIPDDRLAMYIDKRNSLGQDMPMSHEVSLVDSPYLDKKRPLKMDVQVPGLLNTIRFVDNEDMLDKLGPDEVQIQARAYGVSFKDVSIALGHMVPGTNMTGEVAGLITAVGSNVQSWQVNDRVAALFVAPFGNEIRTNSKNVVSIPDSVTFAEAASISLVFFTAWYCLTQVARIEKGQSILIHAGAGGVGQAAIQLAQRAGAEVFTTVSSTAKKMMIQQQYGLPDSHIFSSNSGHFKKQILDRTQGTGVDIVLNSLPGQLLRDSFDCLAPFGTFFEIGQRDSLGRGQLSMAKFGKQATFATVDASYMHCMRPAEVIRGTKEIFAMIDKKVLKAVYPVTTFDMSRIEQAFRLIAERKHTGKLVLLADEHTLVRATVPRALPLRLHMNGTYVIGGGLGDLGKKMGVFLAEKGAGHIVALTRRSVNTVAQQPAILEVHEAIRKLGGTLHAIQCDITKESSVRNATEKMAQLGLPPVRGIIQSATVLRDHPFEYMELEDWRDSMKPKVQGTINMHKAFCSSDATEFFVMLSSVASIVGSASQSNYAAGNAFLDAFAHARTEFSRGITRYATINVGVVEGSELVAGALEQRSNSIGSIGSVSFDDVLAALEYSINPHVRFNIDDTVQHLMHFNRDTMEDVSGPSALSDPMYDHVPSKRTQGDRTIDNSAGEGNKKKNVLQAIEQAESIAEAENIVKQSLVNKFTAFIGDDVPDEVPIAALGLDSLVSIELKNWAKHTFRTPLQISELGNAHSMLDLAKLIVSRMNLKPMKVVGTSEGAIESPMAPKIAAVPTVDATDVPKTPVKHGHNCCRFHKDLPIQPLPDLDDTLGRWLEANEHLFSPQQLKLIHIDIDAMRAPGSPARQILRDLYDANHHDKTNGWFSDVVTDARFLCRRAPVAPWTSIMGAQSESSSGRRHTQAQRAAVITSSALSFRRAMNHGEVEPLEIAGRPECSWGWGWLFNSTRVPQLKCDKMVSYAQSPDDRKAQDHIAVLRKGHVFRLKVQNDDGEDVTLKQLEASFEAIMARVSASDVELGTGLLTTDERDSWAKIREDLLALSPSNFEYFHVLDSAVFVLCLDEGRPDSPEEIARQGYVGNGLNRWFDKVLQFYVSANGRSGLITEHGIIDGTTPTRLLQWIAQAMDTDLTVATGRTSQTTGGNMSFKVELKEVVLQTTPEIEGHATVLQERYKQATSRSTYVREDLEEFGTDFLLKHRAPVKGVIDLTFQLAVRLFFGQNMVSWEPTSGSIFHAGRADAMQRATPEVNAFCDAAAASFLSTDDMKKPDRGTPNFAQLWALLLAATKSMNVSMQMLLTGRNSQRVFKVLDYLWPTAIAKPEFLSKMVFFGGLSPPIFAQTNSLEGKAVIQDYVHIMPNTDGFWAFICPEKNTITISLTGGSEERVAAFVVDLHRAARIVHAIVQGSI